MSPSRIDEPADFWDPVPAKKSIFPDGIKTSGQQEPIYAFVRPYDDFPKHITGPTVWKKEDFLNSAEKWTHRFTEEEIKEISLVADRYIENDFPLTGITKNLFPLPILSARMEALKNTLLDGQGFWLFKGLPVQQWGLRKSATAYMGIGTHLGYFTSQNSRGHVLGHVKDLGEDPTKTDKVRIYRTNARQYFHTDATDFVGLLCMARAQEGGESDIVSMHHVFNILQRDHPDVAETLCSPSWYLDRKGEVSAGQKPWIRAAVFYLEHTSRTTDSRAPRLYGKFDPMNVTSLTRFSTGPNPSIPAVTPAQTHAMAVLEEVCLRESLHMILEPGDIQFLSNSQVFHARTAYKDFAPGTRDEEGRERQRRHLMRLWLSVPLEEGGWRLPYPDARCKKRGGIQVDDVPPVCPLDAE